MTPEKTRQLSDELHRAFNTLHYRQGFEIMDINALALGLITCSMQNTIGPEQAREFITSAMDNVWGKPKKKRWWQRS